MYTTLPSLCRGGDWTQDSMYSRKAFYHWATSLAPQEFFSVCCFLKWFYPSDEINPLPSKWKLKLMQVRFFLVTADVFAFAVLSSNPGQVFCHCTVSPTLTSGYLNCPSWSTYKASCVPWLVSLAAVYISVIGAPLIFGEWGSSPPYLHKLFLPLFKHLHFLVVQETMQVSPLLVNPSPTPR